MSFRQELMKHLAALPVTDVKKLVSKYNKELDIKPISRLKKEEILQKIRDKKPMDQQLLAKLTNEARAKREGKKAQKASEKEAAKKPVEKSGTEKKKIKVKKAKPDFLDLDKDGDKKEPMKKAAKEAKKSAPKAMPKEDAKAFAAAFAKAPEEEKGSLFSDKPKKFKGVAPEPSKAQKELTKELNRVLRLLKTKPFKNKPLAAYRGAPNVDNFYANMLRQQKTIKGIKEVEKLIRDWEKKNENKNLKGESATTKTTNTIIENWDKSVNNVELEQKEKQLTDTIRSQLEKKGSLNIDGLFSANPKLANDLFAKYPPQKVLDGYKKYVEYLDDEGEKEIRQDKITDYFEERGGRLQPTFRGKGLNQASIAKIEKANEFKLSKPEAKKDKIESFKTVNGKIVNLTKVLNLTLSAEQKNKHFKEFLVDFKRGRSKFGRKVALKEYKENLDDLKEKIDDNRDIVSAALASINDKKRRDMQSKRFNDAISTLISESNKLRRLYNRYFIRYDRQIYLNDYESKR